MWQIWLIFSGIFFIAEIITVGFLIFWLAIGALFAMIVSFFTDNIIIQTSVFVISSTVLIFATKPFVKKFAKGKSNFKSNVYSIIGDTGIVTKKIDSIESTGQVKVNGELWSAVGKDDIWPNSDSSHDTSTSRRFTKCDSKPYEILFREKLDLNSVTDSFAYGYNERQ